MVPIVRETLWVYEILEEYFKGPEDQQSPYWL